MFRKPDLIQLKTRQPESPSQMIAEPDVSLASGFGDCGCARRNQPKQTFTTHHVRSHH